MAKIVQLHRMNSAAAAVYAGPQGEVIVDTGSYAIRVQDAVTPGGHFTCMASLNLSDLADKVVARNNLGAAPLDSPNFTTNAQVEGDDVVTKNAAQTLTNKQFTSPILVTPVLGTPSSGNLTNCTGYDAADLVSLGAGVGTLLGQVSTGTGGLVGKSDPAFPNRIFVGETIVSPGIRVTPTPPNSNHDLGPQEQFSGNLIILTWDAGTGFALLFCNNLGGMSVVASSNGIGGDAGFDTVNNFASNTGIAAFITAGRFIVQIKAGYGGGDVKLSYIN